MPTLNARPTSVYVLMSKEPPSPIQDRYRVNVRWDFGNEVCDFNRVWSQSEFFAALQGGGARVTISQHGFFYELTIDWDRPRPLRSGFALTHERWRISCRSFYEALWLVDRGIHSEFALEYVAESDINYPLWRSI